LGLTDIAVLDPKREDEGTGAGIVGQLAEPMDKEDFIALVKEVFDAACVRFNSWSGEKVGRVALCGGAGAFLMSKAVAAGADAFLTGEVGYHRFFGHENELLLMELGHFESEQYTLEILREVIAKAAPTLPLYDTEVETNPINYI
jgi:putative NIF3 family GTP cyclohydrolase 1 type 2